jgi:hypothetical protein
MWSVHQVKCLFIYKKENPALQIILTVQLLVWIWKLDFEPIQASVRSMFLSCKCAWDWYLTNCLHSHLPHKGKLSYSCWYLYTKSHRKQSLYCAAQTFQEPTAVSLQTERNNYYEAHCPLSGAILIYITFQKLDLSYSAGTTRSTGLHHQTKGVSDSE